MIVKKGFYPTRQLQVLDMMIEKGKGPVLSKLQMIQLIEADLQLLMRIFLMLRNVGVIEQDKRLSKFNYGSRKIYPIEEVLLEKQLICDSAVFSKQMTIHAVTDLQVYYNRQLPKLCGVIEESIDID